MPNDNTARRLRHLPGIMSDARTLETLLADPATAAGVRAALRRALTEAMDARGVSIITPAVAKTVFLAIFDRNTDHTELDAREDAENAAAGCRFCHYRSAAVRLLTLIYYAEAGDLEGFKEGSEIDCKRCREALRRTADGDGAPAHVLDPSARVPQAAATPAATERTRPGVADARARLKRLRAQLDRLDYAPENEGARFQLEREIERTERELEAGGEWPDVIDDGEGGAR